MDMNIVTPPKKGLKTTPYSMNMNKENNIATLPKKGLKTRPYSMDMNMDNNVATLPKKDLKTRPYNIGMEKRDLKTRHYSKDMNERDLTKYDYTMYMDMEKKDLKKLTKGQLIKLLLKKVSITMRTYLTTTHLRMKLHKSLQNVLNQLHHRELENGKV